MFQVHLAGQHTVGPETALAGEGAAELPAVQLPVLGDGRKKSTVALTVDPAPQLRVAGGGVEPGEGHLRGNQALDERERFGNFRDHRPPLGLATEGPALDQLGVDAVTDLAVGQLFGSDTAQLRHQIGGVGGPGVSCWDAGRRQQSKPPVQLEDRASGAVEDERHPGVNPNGR